ncbi:YbjN domain-containing protein [Corynebacterium sp. H130]|uniref:YbjN domain-containing protein n=1 Tax=Corynebacterium sp. H130 TaxID=3133444 RepID=UPI00309CBB64
MEVTNPRLLSAARAIGVQLTPTPTARLWVANLNDHLVQFLLLPASIVMRVDLPAASIPTCNAVNASPLFVSAALIDGPEACSRLEYTFPTAAGLSDDQLQHLLKTGLDHLFEAKKQLL